MNMELFKAVAQYETSNLLQVLINLLGKNGYEDIITDNVNYIVAKGDIDICLLAHLDTVFKTPPSIFYYDEAEKVMWSPQGMGADDRAGVAAILTIIAKGLKPHIIFTTGEETGCIGAGELVKNVKTLPFIPKMFIQLDRHGEKDCVFYSCDNPDFTKEIENFGFVTNLGSFTDISVIAPTYGIAAVNLSIGYQYEHNPIEILHTNWFDATLDKVVNILTKEQEIGYYKYIPAKHSGFNYSSMFNFYTDDSDDLSYYYAKPEKNKCYLCGEKLTRKNRIKQKDSSGTYFICRDCKSLYAL